MISEQVNNKIKRDANKFVKGLIKSVFNSK